MSAPRVQHPVWRCDCCGRFYSERTADRHEVCARITGEEESGYHWAYGVHS